MRYFINIIAILISFTMLNAITISSCQDLDSSGYYELNQNVNSVGTCFTINVSDVELNCNGYFINHSGNAVDGDPNVKDNITIRNCRMFDHSTSQYTITLSDTTNSLITNNNITNEFGNQDAIGLWQSSNNIIENNYVVKYEGNFDPIYIYQDSNNNTIRNNIVIHLASDGIAASGINVRESYNNTVENNFVYMYNQSSSMALRFRSNTNNNTFRNNYAYSELGTGIRATSGGSSGNLIYNNIINASITTNDVSTLGNNWNNSIIGNYYANPSNTGFSQTCVDGNNDQICDSSLVISGVSRDFLPIALENVPSLSLSISQLPIGDGSYTTVSQNVGGGSNLESNFNPFLFPLGNIYLMLILLFGFFIIQ